MNKFTLLDEKVFRLFCYPGEVVEVRGIGFWGASNAWNGFAKGTVSGYFDSHKEFCNAVKLLDATEQGNIYFTLQVIDKRLIGRAFNRIKASDVTTSDNNVFAYRWLPIDIDPERPSGISSSDSEFEAAVDIRDEVIDYVMERCSFPQKPITSMSGNGVHILFKLPEKPAIPEHINIISFILQDIAMHFNNESVHIDTAVYNPARIWTLYGTTKRKGDPVPSETGREARPHRLSYIDSLGEYGD